jgi:hypothetical protein
MRKSEKTKYVSKTFRMATFSFCLLPSVGSWKLGGWEKVCKTSSVFRNFAFRFFLPKHEKRQVPNYRKIP